MVKDRLTKLQGNVSVISIHSLEIVHFWFKIEIHGNGEYLSIVNHFAVVDMEEPLIADVFYKVRR